MKTATVVSMRASLEVARQYVEQTRTALSELQRQRRQITADIAALEARPLPWAEVVNEMVTASVDDCAERYVSTLAAWIRQRNPGLSRRGGYDDLPVFGQEGEWLPAALCYFNGDEYKAKLRALFLTFQAPHPADQCISAKDRATQRAALDEQLQTIDGEIARLGAELAELRG